MPDQTPEAPAPAASEAPQAAGSTPEAAKAAPAAPEVRKHKFPIPDVGEVELTDEDVVGVLTQFAKLRSEDLAGRKEKEDIDAHFSDDAKIAEYLRKRGKDPSKLAEAWLSKELQAQLDAANLTPEQKRIKELEARLAEGEQRTKAEEDARNAAKQEALDKAEFERLVGLVDDALAQTAIPKELQALPETRRRVGRLVKRNAELGTEVPMPVLAKLIEQEILKEQDLYFAKMTPDTLYQRLGRKGVEALIRKYAEGLQPKPEAAPVAPPRQRRSESAEDPAELRRKARELSYQRAREDQALVNGTALRPQRYTGGK